MLSQSTKKPRSEIEVWSEFSFDQILPPGQEIFNKETGVVDYAIDRVATKMVTEVVLQATNNPIIVGQAEQVVIDLLVGDWAMCRGFYKHKGDPYQRTLKETQQSLYAEADIKVADIVREWIGHRCLDVEPLFTIIPYIPWPLVGRAVVDRGFLSDMTVTNIYAQLVDIRDSSPGKYRDLFLSLEGGMEWGVSTKGYSEYATFKSCTSVNFEQVDLKEVAEKLARSLSRDGN